MSSHSKKLVEQQQALAEFFDALMLDVQSYATQEASAAAAAEADEMPETTPVVHKTIIPLPAMTPAKKAAAPIQLVVEPVASLGLFAPLPPVATPVPIVEEVAVPVIADVPVTEPELLPTVSVIPAERVESPLPAWANTPFQAMLFKVAGLTLAVPLIELNGVVEWHDKTVTEMPGHADFYLGLMPYLGQKVALIDTARLVLPPEKLRALAGDDPRARIKRIVLINEGKYGLACDDVAQVIILKPTDVRWRTSRTQRRWLAGTVVAHMCALIDASAFAQMLTSRMPVTAFRE